MSQMSSLQICVFWHRQWVEFIHFTDMLETQTVTILVYAVLAFVVCPVGQVMKSQKLLLLNETCKADELFSLSAVAWFQFLSILVFSTKSDLESFVFEASKHESLSPSPAALWHNQDLSTKEHQHLSAAMFVFQYAKEGKKRFFWTVDRQFGLC